MTVISINSASFCRGLEVAEAVSERLGCSLVTDRDMFIRAATSSDLRVDDLARLVYGPARIMDRLKDDSPRQAGALRVAMAHWLENDGAVFFGDLGYLIPKTVTHVLKIGLVGSRATRLEAAEKGDVAKTKAEQAIRRDDEGRAAWVNHLLGKRPWDSRLFDMVLPVDEQTTENLALRILEHAEKPAVATTEASLAAVSNFKLAAEVQLALAGRGHDVDVQAEDGAVDILIKKRTLFIERLQQQLVDIATALPGVRTASARPGPRYREANLYLDVRSELPDRVLLVDDEKEFVETLSKRLRSRDIDSSVAYGGEEALARVDDSAPEVMVLDLRMPGIDGIEVLRNVKANHPEIEVIILTAHGTEAEERLVFQLGAFAYLRKPVDIGELTDTMKRAHAKVRGEDRGAES